MRIKNVAVFFLTVFVFFMVSMYRFKDSGHAIAVISRKGGSVRHAVHVNKTYGCSTVIVTARVIPPYQGDARVVIEGEKKISYDIYFEKPVIDFGIKPWPKFKDNVLYGIKPGVRIALWIVMRDIEKKKKSDYHLCFYDTRTNRSVLKVPILFE